MKVEKAINVFKNTYPTTWQIARDLIRGKSDEYIMNKYRVSVMPLAAVKAHLNRSGKYSTLANNCNF